MELKTYLAILWRRKWVIVITTVVTVTATIVGTFLMTPIYVASTTLRVASTPGGSVSYTDYMYATRLMNTYARLITSRSVLNELAQRLGLDEPPKVAMEILGNTELMRLTVEHPSPHVAQEAANTLAGILIDLNKELYVEAEVTAQEILGEQLVQAEGELNEAKTEYESFIEQFPDDLSGKEAVGRALELKQQTYTTLLEQFEQARVREGLLAKAVSVFEPADLPEAPSKPRKMLFLALGMMVGLTGGLGLSFLFENLDSTLHTTAQIEKATALPTLGHIPFVRKRSTRVILNGRSPYAEAYRRLRNNIGASSGEPPLHTLLVTSAVPGEGKSTVVANLARAVGQSGRRVVIVDADLRRPVQHRIFGFPNDSGLCSLLEEQEQLEEFVATFDPTLEAFSRDGQEPKIGVNDLVRVTDLPGVSLLTSGPTPADPAALLGSSRMTILLEHLAVAFDLVLLDAPCLQTVADAAALATVVDGVLLVVRRTHARKEAVRAARAELAYNKARCIGTVVNQAGGDNEYRYYRVEPVD